MGSSVSTKTNTTDWCVKQLEKLFITLFWFTIVLVSGNGKCLIHSSLSFFNSRAVMNSCYEIHKTTAPYRKFLMDKLKE